MEYLGFGEYRQDILESEEYHNEDRQQGTEHEKGQENTPEFFFSYGKGHGSVPLTI